MKRRLALLVLGLLAAGVPAWGHPTPVRAAERSRVEQDPPSSLLGGRKGGKALVVLLHGGSFSGVPSEELARRALQQVSTDARRLGLTVLAPVAPDGCSSSVPFLEPAGEARVLAALDDVLAEGRVDPTRVTLAGHGAGGTAALTLAGRYKRRFAAVAVWSATPGPLLERMPDGGERLLGLAPDPVPDLASVPVYLFTAEDDRWLDRRCLNLFVQGMETAAQVDPRWSLNWERGQGGHGYGARGPRPGLKFLAGHRRQEPP